MIPFFGRSKSRKINKKATLASPFVERLEERALLTTFTVTNLNDSGEGSFRQALISANSAPGADDIEFDVEGTITLNSSLPAITDTVNIDGTSAPGYEDAPVVEIDYNGKAGLTFVAGSDHSWVEALALVHGSGSGVTIKGAGDIRVEDNYIGLDLDGVTAEGNRGNGIEVTGSNGNRFAGNVISSNEKSGISLNTSNGNVIHLNYIGTDSTGTIARGNAGDGISLTKSNDNLIGHDDPVSGISYYGTDGVELPVSGWQGIRGGDTDGEYIIVGTSGPDGLLYIGNIEGTDGTAYAVDYPGEDTYNTSVYGPNNLGNGNLQLVGVYKNDDYETADVKVHGFIFEGTVADLDDAENYATIDYPGATFTYLHSIAGGLVVGNYDSAVDHGTHDLPLGPGHAFIYDLDGEEFTEVTYPGSNSNSVYGIWQNGEHSYTLVGGYSNGFVNNFEDPETPLGNAFIVDYNSETGEFSNWTTVDYPFGVNFISHFEGISSVEKGIYTLNAQSVATNSEGPSIGSFVTIRRNDDGSFGPSEWVNLNASDSNDASTTSDSVFGNAVIGVVLNGETISGYQATVNSEFQLSNVISSNGGNGINLSGSNGNVIAMNNIGTDVTGLEELGNSGNGILVTSKSANNLIGGEAVAGNDPTNDVFVRPPQGNLISGNAQNGVLINGKSTGNQLSGNYIGTDATGNSDLGNQLNGVMFDNADGNSLIGCSLVQDPFIYYNVIGGNVQNGLVVHNSDNTTIQANFFGMGADNDTAVGNGQNGVVISGNSSNTTMGGPIPLGNVVSANDENGIVLQDKVKNFVSFNSFVGIAAFTENDELGNGQDGFLITTTGGGINIRTNVISSNGDDGIEVSGKAKDVRIFENMIGTNTVGTTAIGNADNGIEVGGKAKDILIGGPTDTFSIIPHNVISGNGNHGVEIHEKANNITVNASYVGTNVFGNASIGNAFAGILIAEGTKNNTIGSSNEDLLTVVSGNGGHGIELRGTTGNTIIGTYIGTDDHGEPQSMGNTLNGIFIQDSSKNVIGSTSNAVPANLIAYNDGSGIFVQSGSENGIHRNSILDNDGIGINLAANANENAVAPGLTSAFLQDGNITINGTLTAKSKTTYTIEFFASALNNASGEEYLGSITVKTDSNGVAVLAFTTLHPTIGLDIITATATDSKDNTSQFSDGVDSSQPI